MASGGSRTIRRTVEHGVRQVSGADFSGSPAKALAVAAIKEQRDNEKQELIKLNDRFAAYIDRVKYLEATNKQLQARLDELRSRWGIDSDRLRQEYEPQLNDARRKIDQATADKARAEIKSKRAEFDVLNYKRLCDDVQQWANADKAKISALEATLRENQAELEHLHRLMNDSMNDIEKYRNEMKHLYEEISRLLIELDNETMARIKIENEKQTLEEQIPFLSAIHEQEMNELRTLSSGNIGIDPTTFYKNELQRAIREIRNDFENLSRAQRQELEEYYRIKTDEIVQQAQRAKREQGTQQQTQESSSTIRTTITETKKEMADLQNDYNSYLAKMSDLESRLETLKRENTDNIDSREREILELRSKLNELMASYDEIASNKSSLEFEINTYRRLLESEEAHAHKFGDKTQISTTHKEWIRRETTESSSRHEKHVSPQRPIIPPVIADSTKISQTEMQAKTTFQRSAKGPINIDECSPDGKFVILANTSKNKDIDLTGWRLLRKVDDKKEITFSLPPNFKLQNGKNVKIYAGGHGRERPPYDLVHSQIDSWGIGVNIVTRLLNDQNEEKATHIQKTVYAA
ncbi:unnamed protein product [Didymodactylos carnosus]|uniref:Intermediate filament protein n=1 Tax=Didymodactylos carnosus TaxID=1234261 RepID=A0A813TYN2_9BILA|nr:unnamed protein product [Didymodactylos carnosus]CAF1059100.1 unnamed protein product [Didymodactylos carnosus]CAF3604509.1 unnamed protein product [Didymodactylos carnosus]CAF3824887.1 unnamed protein product [Didymodactylos carnosus]